MRSSSSYSTTSTIEFLGLPGVGKSTLSRRVAIELTNQHSPVSEPIRQIDDRPGLYRILSKARFAAKSHLRTPKNALATTRSIHAADPGSISDLLRVAFNLHYVTGVTARARSTTGVTLLDQGLYQGIWSVGLHSPSDWSHLFDQFDDVLTRAAPDLVVLVEADTETISDRLRSREDGDTRFTPDSPRFDRGVEGYKVLKKRFQSDDDTPRSIVVTNETRVDLDAGVNQVVDAVRSLPD